MEVKQDLNLVAIPHFGHKISLLNASLALTFLTSVIYVQK